MSCLIAFKAASTGPTPVLAVSLSSPSISNFTVAVGETLAPMEMLKPLMTIGVSRAEESSVIAIAIKSSSVTHFPLSPKDFISSKTLQNCSSFKSM